MGIRVGIIEDDAQARRILAGWIHRGPGTRCIADYGDAETAVSQLPALDPEVVISDINLPGMNGVECVRKLKQILPETQVMMLTAYEDTQNIFNSLAAGASGYLLKRAPRAELLDAIREVTRGGSPMSTHIARLVVQSFQRPVAAPEPVEELSDREREVLELLSQGLMYKEIAEKLGISFETVRTYIRRIYEKLHVRTRTEAVAKALRR